MSTENNWRLGAETATLDGGSWEATIDFANPSAGTNWKSKQTESQLKLFQIEFPEAGELHPTMLADRYLRGDDLVATYEHGSPLHLRPQIYWRAQSVEATGARGFVLQLSLQTDRLDAKPGVDLISELPAGELHGHSSGSEFDDDPTTSPLLLFRADNFALVIAHQPADMNGRKISGSAEAGWTMRTSLLGEHLEKGVIRRSQTACWQLPADKATDQALATYEQFLTAPPPLTV